MPRKRTTDPKKYYTAGGWRVSIAGKVYRLGSDEAAAEERRRKLVGAWLSDGGAPSQPLPAQRPTSGPTVGAALTEYLTRGVRLTLDHRQRDRIDRACAAVIDRYGSLDAAAFGALELKRVREAVVARPSKNKRNHKTPKRPRLSRGYINDLVSCVKTAWRWLASERLVPAWREMELRTLRSLAEGEGGEETPVVLPPPSADVDAALAELAGPARAMAKLQRLTGMRPEEVCSMRRGELSVDPAEVLRPPNALPTAAFRAGDGTLVWAYAPANHKTRRKRKPRLIALGPAAQAVLRPFLLRGPVPDELPPEAFLFRPADTPRGTRPKGAPPAERYTVAAYGNAVRRACRRAGVPPWTPNTLRHGLATEIFADDPLTAMDVLGHSQIAMSHYYAAARLRRAGEHAAKNG